MASVMERDVLGDVLRLIERMLKVPADRIDVDAGMESFGVNSLIAMELMANIQSEFAVTLTPADFAGVETTRDLAGLLESMIEEAEGGSRQPAEPAAPVIARAATPPAATPAPVAMPVAAPEKAPVAAAVGPGDAVRLARLVERAERLYGVELAYREFGSIEAIADALVEQHAEALAQHYRLAPVRPARHAAPAGLDAVAIVGMSCRFPDAGDPLAFWDNLIARRNSVAEIPVTRWDWTAHYAPRIEAGRTVSKWGALLEDVDRFDAEFFGVSREEAAMMDPQLRLLMQESYRAIEDAGYAPTVLAGTRTGVFVGYEYSEFEQLMRRKPDGASGKPPFSSSSPSYYLANRVSHVLDVCGPSEALNVNCASAAVAVNRAFQSLRQGESDAAIVAAASLHLTPGDYIAASQYGILSPDGSNGVFDEDANGFVRGEGVAALLLKRLGDAERDGDRIYAVIRACHENHRGAARHISEVRHEAITAVLRDCYERAGIDPATVRYVEVDGYASKWADSFEYEGIKAAFRDRRGGGKSLALGSVKGNIGNLEPVSGLASLIKVALGLHRRRMPPTTTVRRLSSFLDVADDRHPLYIADRELTEADLRGGDGGPLRAGVNSFADSGANVHIVVEAHDNGHRTAAERTPGVPRLFVLSARDLPTLRRYAERYVAFLSREDQADTFAAILHTAQRGRVDFRERLAIVASSRIELLEKLRFLLDRGFDAHKALEAKDIHVGSSAAAEGQPLAKLITAEMAELQLLACEQKREWRQVAMLWVNGVRMPWARQRDEGDARRISIPCYPFEGERFAIDGTPAPDAVTRSERLVPIAPAAPLGDARASASAAAAPGAEAPHAPGEDAILADLREYVACRARIAPEAVDDDRTFIELGMDSLSIAEMIVRLDAACGTRLSPAAIFSHPSIGALARHVAALCGRPAVGSTVPQGGAGRSDALPEAGAQPIDDAMLRDCVVTLQPKGAAQPVFAIPGAGGNALSMQQIAHALGASHPFHCIESPGLDGRGPLPDSVAETAALYLRAMKRVQPEGPYALLGYSNGGVVAFEMARQLRVDGERVASLTLVDTLCPDLRDAPVEAMMLAVFGRLLGAADGATGLDADTLAGVPEAQRADFLLAHARKAGLAVPEDRFMAMYAVATASERQCRAYVAEPIPGALEVTLFRAAESYAGAPDDYGWGRFLARAPAVHVVPADHFSIVEKPAAGEVAKRMFAAKAAPQRKPRAGKRTARAV